MTHFSELSVLAVALTAAAAGMLFLSRRHIHRQMEGIAEAANYGAFKRPLRFRAARSLPENHRSQTEVSEAHADTATPAA
jgi:hypothetical protein